MIGYYTDNSVSQAVMRAFSAGGVQVDHINNFKFNQYGMPPDGYYDGDFSAYTFYGLLRGTGNAIRYCQAEALDYYYLDNGYFDAIYMDEKKRKDVSGTYRVVKNALIENIIINPTKTASGQMRALLLPPSPYVAFMYDTTPEDWIQQMNAKCIAAGHVAEVKTKEAGKFVSENFNDYDAIIAFNSMAIMSAIEMGKAVYTTHGIISNINMLDMCAPYYDINEIKKFYMPKQFTLEEIADRGVGCLN